eukprot:COSAG02_NODE_1810_length_10825_cov_43.150848_7_plen_369_part_00
MAATHATAGAVGLGSQEDAEGAEAPRPEPLEGVPPAAAAKAGSSHPADELVVLIDFLGSDQRGVHNALVEGLAQVRTRLSEEQNAQASILHQFEALKHENQQLRRELAELKGVTSTSPTPRTPRTPRAPRTPTIFAESGSPPTPKQSHLDTVAKLAEAHEAHLSRLKNMFSPLKPAPADISAGADPKALEQPAPEPEPEPGPEPGPEPEPESEPKPEPEPAPAPEPAPEPEPEPEPQPDSEPASSPEPEPAPAPEQEDSSAEHTFTFHVEHNPALFSGHDKMFTVCAKDMSELKKAVKSDLGIRASTDIDIYYYDEAFKRNTRPRDLDDLCHASMAVCPKGGQKLAIHVVDSRIGLQRYGVWLVRSIS